MTTSIFQLADALSKFMGAVLERDDTPRCICSTIIQQHGGTFHPRCPTHARQAAVLNPTEPRRRTIVSPPIPTKPQ